MFNLFKRKANPANITVNVQNVGIVAHYERRITELLVHNNTQLEENRQLKRVLKEAAAAAGQSDIGRARELLGAYA